MTAISNKSTQNLVSLRPTTFVPTVVRGILQENSGDNTFRGQTIADFASSSVGNSGSFRYDPIGSGLKSTQQLNVDWSLFENHTFFNSAQVKVNAAFDKIINQYPFDGTQEEVEIFFDKLTGWENYVYQQFPKYIGYQFFSGSGASPSVSGTFIEVKDLAGAAYSAISKTKNGNPTLNPGLKSMTFEFKLFVPSGSNTEQVVFQKLNTTNNHGFGCFLKNNSAGNVGTLDFVAVSGSSIVSTSMELSKSQWTSIAAVWNREVLGHQWQLYKSESLYASSSKVEIGQLDFNSANFYIGSGSAITGYTPTTTLSGAMDELRIWHSLRNQQQIQEFSSKGIFAGDNLKLYLKFNEPLNNTSPVVLDSSGNGLHGTINDYGFTNLGVKNIATASIAGSSSLSYEQRKYNPVLFPDNTDLNTLRAGLLGDAVVYDASNLNQITNLVPRHYLLEGQSLDATATEEGPILTDLVSGSNPRSSKMGSTQITLSLLYTMAAFFDEIKLYLQNFSTLNKVDYATEDTISDQLLQFLADKHGIKLPPMFTGTSIEQYINGNNYGSDYDTNNYSLQYIQNQIWRRILINARDMMSSKGTVHSVKSFIRSVGIDPDNNFRIREYGGPTRRNLHVSRESRSEVAAIASFVSGGYAISPFLSGARIEPGFPEPRGSFVTDSNGNNIGTTQTSDGLFTSGSWTFEGTYIVTGSNAVTQSFVRMGTTGSTASGIFANLVVGGASGSLTLYIRPGTSQTDPTLTLNLTSSANLQTNEPWFVSFGRERGDSFGFQTPSSSYFLRAARQSFGEIVEEYTTSSFFYEGVGDVNKNISSTFNASGSYFEIGSGSITNNSYFLNSTSSIGDEARRTVFNGKVGNVRFWSKPVSITEWREHVRNFKSLGVSNPLSNFNFVSNVSGAFEKLRMDVSMDQASVSSSAGGSLLFNDFSQNNYNLSGSSFTPSTAVIVPQRYHYSLISPKFDIAATNNKVRVRSFSNLDNLLNNDEAYAEAAPVYELLNSEAPTDNNRFTIDYSIVDALNQDIINIFSGLDTLDNALGEPALMFSSDYPTLENLRNVYFNRLTDKMNFKAFFEFYKWFDTNLGSFIAQLLPRKTSYNGINYLVESHMLERSKFQYRFDNNYLGSQTKDYRRSEIQILAIEGAMRKI